MVLHREPLLPAFFGATTVPRFTDVSVKALQPPPEGHVTVWERPLGVRVSSTGTKTYIIMIGSGRRHSIGKVGDITLAQARSAAARIRAEVTLGKVFPEAVSVATARETYLSQAKIRPSTREYYTRYLAKLSGDLTAVKTAHINLIIDALPTAARAQAIASYRPFFNWCVKRGYIDKSPVNMTAPQSTRRDRVLSDHEITAIWKATEEPTTFNSIVRLLLLTGQRKGQIAALQTSWLQKHLIVFPREIMKNGRDHILPVGELGISLLHHQKEKCSSGLLFPARGTDTTPFNGWSKSKAALDKKLGSSVAPWTLHDLRRTAATIWARLRIDRDVREMMLAHTIPGVQGIYDRWDRMPEMTAAMQKYEKFLLDLRRCPKTAESELLFS